MKPKPKMPLLKEMARRNITPDARPFDHIPMIPTDPEMPDHDKKDRQWHGRLTESGTVVDHGEKYDANSGRWYYPLPDMPRNWQPQKNFNINYDWWLIPKPMIGKKGNIWKDDEFVTWEEWLTSGIGHNTTVPNRFSDATGKWFPPVAKPRHFVGFPIVRPQARR